ncbi:3-phosphoshikimate 1-carboxyvinyltransferase [Parvularcula bermudensis HTCC2503]|uniref:3-phosphoshikimate 1-carboxyvinyltransferase n=1 Tax=Parvularcula bermudensis (strain ATCC BAA-594 / HTCC2503 / KCTC 12087) TaxID=314260 RepID=E0TG58_PARBH|nr:3-phosphoshikimate 1-carboxyvinyltransferase [Parvularcula bermudensis]ADM10629.1 3-phosphoshikimate 1-carboxyvinyltransferase [Parvularcula bermudensis HTCC2503]
MVSTYRSRRVGPLNGAISPPGDKSVSHRALILGGLAEGTTTITGLLEADDVLRTASCVRGFGAAVERQGEGSWTVTGASWSSPAQALYCGNSGTGARLLMGAAAGQGVSVTFDGDQSLRGRPMERILAPLREMGIESDAREGKLPVRLVGGRPRGIEYRLPKPSAQIKSAVLLAGLGAEGETVIEEPVPCRDHTERMLPQFGGRLTIEPLGGGGRRLRLPGAQRLTAGGIVPVPGDPSSAAFPLAAAAIVDGSVVTLRGVMTNPHRTGFFEALSAMGADLSTVPVGGEEGEAIADLTLRYAPLTAIHITADKAPGLIDEYPILCVVAAFAAGTSRFDGLGELRVKESDRLAATAALLRANGVDVRTGEDWIEIDGGRPGGGGAVATHHDHRIAMSALVMGMATAAPVTIDDADMIATSFPGFIDLMNGLGAAIEPMATEGG